MKDCCFILIKLVLIHRPTIWGETPKLTAEPGMLSIQYNSYNIQSVLCWTLGGSGDLAFI